MTPRQDGRPERNRSMLYVVVILIASLALIAQPEARAVEVKVVTPDQLMALFIQKPEPEYPYEARRNRTQGRGLFRMYVDADGKTRKVGIMKSTGSKILDIAAAGGLMRSRVKPGRRREIDLPVTFTMRY